ncbi:MAG: Asp-tRNA(Asn)/Glu-tRNA(Gln) amidotransferase subunit GatC [Flavobacteriales bacterium]|nr:Asp-tRNA(Asn)/Glu-tRNA(Gln) amidotransferase subunit GatC [Flavobacteriales bacterium]
MNEKIDSKTVERIAELSKLEFNDEEKKSVQNNLNRILAFVEKLNEVNTTGIEPLIYMVEEKGTLREDEAKQTITQQEALKNAPKKDSDYFKVPRMIKKS